MPYKQQQVMGSSITSQGNIIKYLWRDRYKNGIEDLKKAQWYLNKLIEVNDADQSVLDFTNRRR